MTIHWCGTGLSAIPGLRRLIAKGLPVVVWNRSVDKAKREVGDLTDQIRAFDLAALVGALQPKDVVVSMLPADMHPAIARECLAREAHFVSSSYISPEMALLDAAAKAKGLSFVNEVGLDPGIDHLMAHDLVERYRASEACDPENELSFISYCGGVPKEANDFKYKFSWSPLGVLRALRSPSKSLRNWQELNVARPWDAIGRYDAPLPVPESFEVYPNRDSLPFIKQYKFDPAWKVKNFVRGTLRLDGWAEAWSGIFREVETLTGPEGDARLREISEQLWNDYQYDEGEADRVVLCVDLKAEREGKPVWHQAWVLDAFGDARGTAMSRLVSSPVVMAVEAVAAGRMAPGVSAAPHDPKVLADWLEALSGEAQVMNRVDYLA